MTKEESLECLIETIRYMGKEGRDVYFKFDCGIREFPPHELWRIFEPSDKVVLTATFGPPNKPEKSKSESETLCENVRKAIEERRNAMKSCDDASKTYDKHRDIYSDANAKVAAAERALTEFARGQEKPKAT